MICTRDEVEAAPDLISELARYTFEAVLEPTHTMDIQDYFGDSTLRALLFADPHDSPALFNVLGQECSLLLCMGITAEELEYKAEHGSEALLERLRAAKVFPYTVPDRPSMV